MAEARPVASSTPVEISPHLCRVFSAVRDARAWVTAQDIAQRARVAPRTARAHAQRLAELGVFEVARVFGGYRYRCAAEPSEAARSLAERIYSAGDVFGSRCDGGDG